MQRTCSSGISPRLCSMFTFIFNHFNSKRSFLGSGYKYQNSHCEEKFKYSEFTFKALVENHYKKFCSCLCLLSCEEKQNHKTLRNKACLQPCPCLDQVYKCGTRVLLVSSWMCLQFNVSSPFNYSTTANHTNNELLEIWEPGSADPCCFSFYLLQCAWTSASFGKFKLTLS